MKANRFYLATALLALLLGSGCVHPLEVRNLDAYQTTQMSPLQVPLTIGLVPTTDDSDSLQLLKGVGSALGSYSAKVLLPYNPQGAMRADVVARVKILPEYRGSGWNFLINFPGFLIWTPAWNGYVYEVEYNVEVLLSKGSDNSRIDSLSIPILLDVRHANFNRTWTEISWFEVGIIALVGGMVFTQYDPGVTPVLVDRIKTPIGDYLAQEIVTRINNSGAFGPPLTQ